MDRLVKGRTFEILLQIAGTPTPSNQFAIPILCEFVCLTTHPIRHGHELFLLLSDLIAHSCWRTLAFEALLVWISHEPHIVQSKLLSNPQAVVTIMQNPQPRLETDAQCVAQLYRLTSVGSAVFKCLVEHNLFGYLKKLCIIADAKLSLDMLKIIQSFIRISHDDSIHAKYHKRIVSDCLHILKETQNSAVVQAQIQVVQLDLNKSLHS
jgi:hypothetical protein